MTDSHLYPVILAGGSGTRFWPLSRRLAPKQLLSLTSERTMLQDTVLRIGPAASAERIWVVTGRDLVDETRRQLRVINVGASVISEPVGRNTALAIAVAAERLLAADPDAVMAVLPADHAVAKPDVFLSTVALAADVARDGYLVTIGIVPRRPETGYGYIERGAPLTRGGEQKKQHAQAFRVERFVEKPDRGRAEQYVAAGNYFWNSGMFVWRASDIIEELRRYASGIASAGAQIARAMAEPVVDENHLRALYEAAESVSIDYAVMERSRRVAVVPAEFGWNDVGSWAALDDVAAKDEHGNVISGRVVDVDSRRSIVYAQDRVVATIGLDNLIVVDTPDATLVCAKDRAQEVRKVVDALEAQRAQEHIVHKTVQRPWGTYTVLGEGPGYKIKRIVVNPAARLSLQMHRQRSEHWVVVSGTARVTCGERVYDVKANESTYIPPETKHRLENVEAQVPLEIIEVQNGPYLGEDDIVRFDDDFGRK
jgi:mannose-1-phosphate guanylyltransferase/mannose-6-phosphate isomerase